MKAQAQGFVSGLRRTVLVSKCPFWVDFVAKVG
jgi:hypothetical protein